MIPAQYRTGHLLQPGTRPTILLPSLPSRPPPACDRHLTLEASHPGTTWTTVFTASWLHYTIDASALRQVITAQEAPYAWGVHAGSGVITELRSVGFSLGGRGIGRVRSLEQQISSCLDKSLLWFEKRDAQSCQVSSWVVARTRERRQ